MLRVHGLHGHIAKNNAISIGLIAGFIAVACALWVVAALWGLIAAFAFTGIVGAIVGNMTAFKHVQKLMLQPEIVVQSFHVPIAVSVITVLVGLLFLRRIIQQLTKAEGAVRSDEARLYNIVENLSIAAGICMPSVEIIEQGGMNAYATGLSPRFATIAVTRGLLESLDDRELEAVLAHEISHIRNRDTRVMAIAALFGGLISTVAETVWQIFLRRPLSLNDTFQVMGDANGGRTSADEQSRRLRKQLLFVLVAFGGPLAVFHLNHTVGVTAPWVGSAGILATIAICGWLAFGDKVKSLLSGETPFNLNISLTGVAIAIVLLAHILPRLLLGDPLKHFPKTCDANGRNCVIDSISSDIPRHSSRGQTAKERVPAKAPAADEFIGLKIGLMALMPMLYVGAILFLLFTGAAKIVRALNPFKAEGPKPQLQAADRQAALLPSFKGLLFGPLWVLNLGSGAVVSVVYAVTAQVRASVTRAREYMADAGAVELIKDAAPLISALRKIERYDRVDDVPTAFLATMISGPSIGWLATHPTISQRIRALQTFGVAHPISQPLPVRLTTSAAIPQRTSAVPTPALKLATAAAEPRDAALRFRQARVLHKA